MSPSPQFTPLQPLLFLTLLKPCSHPQHLSHPCAGRWPTGSRETPRRNLLRGWSKDLSGKMLAVFQLGQYLPFPLPQGDQQVGDLEMHHANNNNNCNKSPTIWSRLCSAPDAPSETSLILKTLITNRNVGRAHSEPCSECTHSVQVNTPHSPVWWASSSLSHQRGKWRSEMGNNMLRWLGFQPWWADSGDRIFF